MSDARPNYHNHLYAAVVAFGILIVIAAIYLSNSKIEFFEHNTNRIHRLITASQIELETLEREASTIEKTISELSEKLKTTSKDASLQLQLFTMQRNIQRLHADIAEKQKLVISLNLLKTETLSQIKTLFWINSGLLVIGSLMILLGSAALGFRLEIFQDRRRKKREKTQQ